MNYYKVDINTQTGKLLKQYFDKVQADEQAADHLAEELGAIEYVSNFQSEQGGICALIFAKGMRKNPRVWAKVKEDSGLYLYYPNVGDIEDRFFPTDQAQAMSGDHDKIVMPRKVPFHKVPRTHFNLCEACQLAGITRIPGEPDEALTQRTIDILKDKEFQLVTTLHGTRQANDLYRRLQALPQTPMGTLAQILNLRDRKQYPAFMLVDGFVYLALEESLDIADAVSIPHEVYTTGTQNLHII